VTWRAAVCDRYAERVNLLLLEPGDFAADGTVRIGGRRLAHVRGVLAPEAGGTLRVGVVGGRIGTARVAALSALELVLDPPSLTEDPPPRAGLDLLLAVPRPKALAKLLPAVASLGVDRLVLLNAARVEKSYFTAGVLEPASVDALLRLGLEQARDTVPPEVLVRPLFRPFVEDEYDGLLAGTELRLVAHPPAAAPCPHREDARRVALAIGPEGGWVPFEIELLASRGFRPVSLGPRVLRVETVVPLLVGMLR
jgi:RsmE family RNA methyltransferase